MLSSRKEDTRVSYCEAPSTTSPCLRAGIFEDGGIKICLLEIASRRYAVATGRYVTDEEIPLENAGDEPTEMLHWLRSDTRGQAEIEARKWAHSLATSLSEGTDKDFFAELVKKEWPLEACEKAERELEKRLQCKLQGRHECEAPAHQKTGLIRVGGLPARITWLPVLGDLTVDHLLKYGGIIRFEMTGHGHFLPWSEMGRKIFAHYLAKQEPGLSWEPGSPLTIEEVPASR